MTRFLQLVVSGGVSGALFSIIALGLVLTFSTSGIFNFGHAGIAFATAYLYFELNTGLHWPAWIAAVVSVLVFAPLLGLTLDRLLFRRLAQAPIYARIVGTIGLSVALPALAHWIVEQAKLRGASIPDHQQVFSARGLGPSPKESWRVPGGAVLDSDQLVVLGASLFAALAFWVILRHTKLGLRMRADVDRRDLAELRGVNSRAISATSWMLSTTVAGLAGVCLSPFFGMDDVSFTFVVLGSMGAAVIARFRSLPVAFAGGLALGIISNLVAGYADTVLPGAIARLSGLRSAAPFLLTFVALLVWGRVTGRIAGTAANEAPPVDHLVGMPAWRRRLPWILATGALLVYVLLFADDYWSGLFARGVIYGVILLSFTVVTGLGGMVSLAQATFVTAGAFTFGWLSGHGWPFPLAALVAAAVGAATGGVISLPLRRLGALELALATLALAFVADLVIFQVEGARNGSTGYRVTPPEIGPLDLSNPRVLTVAMVVVFGLVALGIFNLRRSASGRAILAARSSDVAARASGLSPDRTKVILFSLSAAIAALGGALLTLSVNPFSNTSAPPYVGLLWLAVVVTWGVRRAGGALIAGVTLVVFGPLLHSLVPSGGVVGDMVSSSRFMPILFGLGAINLAKEPDGLLAMGAATRQRRRRSKGAARFPAASPVVAAPIRLVAPDRDGDASALRVNDLVAGYGVVEVLHRVALDVRPGTIVAVFGANGAGKSTLCKAIAGLVEPAAGSIHLYGDDISSWPVHERARRGIRLAPETRGIFPGLTVVENLAVALPLRSQVDEVLEQFPALRARRAQLAGALSGGEQQQLALAPMLVDPPALLVADEPMLGLAPMVRHGISVVLQQLRDKGVAVLLVEEKVGGVLDIADEVVMMSLGRVSWHGDASEVDASVIASAYFERSAS